MSLARELGARRLALGGVAYPDDRKAAELSAIDKTLDGAPLRGRPVLLSDSDPLRFALAYFALLDRAALPIPVSPEIPDSQLARFQESLPGLQTWIDGTLTRSQHPAPDLPPGAYGCTTSGSTSLPKLCWLGVAGARWNAEAHAESLGINASHTVIQALPLHHSFGIVCYLWTSLVSGAGLSFNTASPSLSLLARQPLRDGVLYLSPAQIRFFARLPRKAPTDFVSIASVGGGPLFPGELPLFAELFPSSRRFVSYGLTEAGPRVLTGAAEARDPDLPFIGRALKGVSLSVQDDSGRMVDRGEGILAVRSPGLKRNLAPEECSDGWLLTRDRVRLVDGDVLFLARSQDVIKVGGASVYPQDIEKVAQTFPGVKDCCVVKLQDPTYEEVPILFVEGQLSVDELTAHLEARLLPVQFPKRIVTSAVFPRTSLQKVDRQALLKLLEAGKP